MFFPSHSSNGGATPGPASTAQTRPPHSSSSIAGAAMPSMSAASKSSRYGMPTTVQEAHLARARARIERLVVRHRRLLAAGLVEREAAPARTTR
jgi:hypothetical protein